MEQGNIALQMLDTGGTTKEHGFQWHVHGNRNIAGMVHVERQLFLFKPLRLSEDFLANAP